ncbi:MAG: amidohydrolase, partial [Lachnospiraceae bacterium]|nr:amidohydrolase [Lachnospiraceae bacterium]
ESGSGHGCGHHLLGTALLGAAIALKEYLSAQGLSGTVIYYGCPAEEGAGAKQFMARAGMFDCCDFVYTWHPSAFNEISPDSSTAIMGANFEFRGVTAHAGGSPWAGRSALDAAELMNVGCNYLREHIRDGERVHYAYGDAGGTAPNVVPDYARIKYEVRSPKVAQVKELFERVVHVAEGAARMTDTQMTCEMTMAFSDSQNNTVLGRIADRALHEVGAPEWTQEDYDLARRFTESYDENSKESVREELRERFGDAALPELLNKPLCSVVLPYNPSAGRAKGGSTDVGDVTYTVPTCEVHVATYAMGTVGHTWQLAGQAGSPIGEKGLLAAAKVMALAAVYTMQDPAAMQAAKEEALRRNGGKYVCPLPDSVDPPVGKY